MPKILIVDDSETFRSQVREALERAGFRTVEAFDGMDGWDCIQRNPDTSLIICDVNMPRMDGLDLCAKIHATPGINKIPIFMLTTETTQELKSRGKSSGVVAWVTKPFDEARLITAVKKATKK